MSKKKFITVTVCVAVGIAVAAAGILFVPRINKKRNEAAVSRKSADMTDPAVESADEGSFDTVETITGPKVIVTDHGVVANDPASAESNLKALNKIMNSCSDGTAVVFPSGKYYVSASKNSGGIQISKKNDFTIFGEKGSVLINTGFTPYVSKDSIPFMSSNIIKASGCRNLVLNGLSFDYKEVTSVSGVITEKKGGVNFVEVDEEYLDRESPLKDGGFADSVHFFDENGVPIYEHYFSEDEAKLTKNKDGQNKYLFTSLKGKVGDRFCVRFVGWSNTAPIVDLSGINGLTVKNIRVLSSPSACFYSSGDSSDYTFDNVRVESPSGSKALMCSNSDCIHISGLRGKLTVKNCNFIGLGDDALNIHLSTPTVSGVSGNTVTLSGSDMKKVYEYCKKGDVVEFFSGKQERLGSAVVTEVKKDKFTFDKLPDGVDTSSALNNISRQPVTVVENCTVKRGRARGLLLQSKEATVSNCTFENLRLPGVLAAMDFDKWNEMGPLDSLTVSGCTFVKCCNDRKNWGAVTVNVGHDDINPGSPKLHGTVTLAGNTYDGNCKNYIIYGAKEKIIKDE